MKKWIARSVRTDLYKQYQLRIKGGQDGRPLCESPWPSRDRAFLGDLAARRFHLPLLWIPGRNDALLGHPGQLIDPWRTTAISLRTLSLRSPLEMFIRTAQLWHLQNGGSLNSININKISLVKSVHLFINTWCELQPPGPHGVCQSCMHH